MMKKNKMKKEVVMHQHSNQFGVFGMKHPEILDHKNEKTQNRHTWTIGMKEGTK